MDNTYIIRCNIIYDILNIDVFLFDTNHNNVYSIQKNDHIPLVNKLLSEDITLLTTTICNAPSQQSYLYTSKYLYCLLGIPLWCNNAYIGCVVVGPFIENAIEPSAVLSKFNTSLKETMLDFYNTLDIFATIRCRKLVSLCYNLFSNPYLKTDTTYIDSLKEIAYPLDVANVIDHMAYWKNHYDNEILLANHIEKGNLEELSKIIANMKLNISTKSDFDSITRTKHTLILLNSYFSRYAINNHVPCMVAYTLSNKYAYVIDHSSHIAQFTKLFDSIFKDYSTLLKRYSSKRFSKLITEALYIIDKAPNTSLTTSIIAKKLHVSSEHLSRKFKEELGVSPTTYIHQTKIDSAIELIKLDRLSLTEIAHLVGYTNYAHFNKWFKKLTGVTPKDYNF